tara:strand:+ start:343 stop:696 length:354 start_codon:yes stop_codon:yes gene_type:complete
LEEHIVDNKNKQNLIYLGTLQLSSFQDRDLSLYTPCPKVLTHAFCELSAFSNRISSGLLLSLFLSSASSQDIRKKNEKNSIIVIFNKFFIKYYLNQILKFFNRVSIEFEQNMLRYLG